MRGESITSLYFFHPQKDNRQPVGWSTALIKQTNPHTAAVFSQSDTSVVPADFESLLGDCQEWSCHLGSEVLFITPSINTPSCNLSRWNTNKFYQATSAGNAAAPLQGWARSAGLRMDPWDHGITLWLCNWAWSKAGSLGNHSDWIQRQRVCHHSRSCTYTEHESLCGSCIW